MLSAVKKSVFEEPETNDTESFKRNWNIFENDQIVKDILDTNFM